MNEVCLENRNYTIVFFLKQSFMGVGRGGFHWKIIRHLCRTRPSPLAILWWGMKITWRNIEIKIKLLDIDTWIKRAIASYLKSFSVNTRLRLNKKRTISEIVREFSFNEILRSRLIASFITYVSNRRIQTQFYSIFAFVYGSIQSNGFTLPSFVRIVCT